MRSPVILILSLFVIAALPAGSTAAEGGATTVTANRLSTEPNKVASSVTIVDRDAIERSGAVFVSDLLHSVPGVQVARSGGAGQKTSIFLRGAKSEHVLVLVDGIKINDPMTPGRGIDLGALTTENLERIEIVRGPQSTLHGSDAIGGVINIITKCGKGKPTFFVSGEIGSHRTHREQAGVSGSTKDERLDYSLHLSRTATHAESAAAKWHGNDERDHFRSRAVSARLGLAATENLDLALYVWHGVSRAGIDNDAGPGGDDPNHVARAEWWQARLAGTLMTCDDKWEQTLGVSFTDMRRDIDNDPDAAHPDDSVESRFDSRLVKFDWQHNIFLVDREDYLNTLSVGIETEKEYGSSSYSSTSQWGPYSTAFAERTARNTGVYVQDRIELHKSFFATVGLRRDDHENFGSHTTWRVAPMYVVPSTQTRVRATYGTGFKSPSLFQLYSDSGNPDLNPEESKSWDAGVEQPFWDGKAVVGATWFKSRFTNLIDWVMTNPDFFTGEYYNVARARSHGVELTASVRPIEKLNLNGSYTRTHTEDAATGEPLPQRPRNKASFGVDYRFLEKKVNVGARAHYVGHREDVRYPAQVDVPSYMLLDLLAGYEVNDNVRIFMRVENLLDKRYEPVLGYGGPSRGVFVGVRLTR
jgi:vitamin B12 transporter